MSAHNIIPDLKERKLLDLSTKQKDKIYAQTSTWLCSLETPLGSFWHITLLFSTQMKNACENIKRSPTSDIIVQGRRDGHTYVQM
ncbi:hypothetical protein K443DRAFT_149777 [Laccaria amethystina LaAM-08-1]|uniref:Uncharacterized protein n=1 Tax=Laccaria amethystina LaAM-08-1 TaxID=1095629 RepID=A0A0C9YBS5_9AGAR|nr:hypothetical protein K443DRAFT_149777 [Laccaria amethystina LaAM-08-1]